MPNSLTARLHAPALLATAWLLASWSQAWPPAEAQLLGAKDGPIAMGHLHVLTDDLDAQRRFWGDALGATPARLGPIEVMKLPDLLILLREAESDGGTLGSSVNHVGLQMPDVAVVVERMRAAGFPVVTRDQIPIAESDIFDVPAQGTRVAFVEAPGGIRIELFENPQLDRPIANHHIHFATADVEEARDWYAQMFGATPRMRGSFESADLPGVNLTFSAADGKVTGTQGRTLDHIGFEVEGLEALCHRLEAEGIVFDRPYTEVKQLGLGIAFFTDPWGTYVELTEGLDGL